MTRRKVKLAFITENSARRATFNKRTKGLLKKVDELSTLCGVDACAVVYSPYTAEPLTFPNDGQEVRRVLRRFRRIPAAERSVKMVNQLEFLQQRVVKAKEKLSRLKRDNRQKEAASLMFLGISAADPAAMLEGLSVTELADLDWIIDTNLNAIKMMLDLAE